MEAAEEEPKPAAVDPPGPRRLLIFLAFASVYLIWGSTYLAIGFVVKTLPPFTTAGVRFTLAGLAMYLWCRARGTPLPDRRGWLRAFLVGGMLLVIGNGCVMWAEQTVPSGVTSLLLASMPLWIVALEWQGGQRPAFATLLGTAIGFCGVALLVGPGWRSGADAVSPAGAAVLLAASIVYAFGSLFVARGEPARAHPTSPLMGVAMQMLVSGPPMLLMGLVTREWRTFDPGAVTLPSVVGFFYLLLFGSLVGYSSYVWLLEETSAARVASCAYVHPLVAVFLGWALAGETLSPNIALAAAAIITSVVIVNVSRARRDRRNPKGERRNHEG